MMCCKVPLIKELEKPSGRWCRHAAIGKGCQIYDERPSVCRKFLCQWMLDPHLGPEWKPEKAKFVVYVQRNGVNLQVAVDPNFPNAWSRPPYEARIRQWVADGAESGRFVFVRIGPRMIALLPGRDVDLGRVDSDDEIVVSRRPGAVGLVYDVEVKRRAAERPASLA